MKLKINALKKMRRFYEENRDEKSIHRIQDSIAEIYFYRRICIYKLNNVINIFDTSTDVYRPISDAEINSFLQTDVDIFCDVLYMQSSKQRIKNNRYYMQLAIAKGNEKEKEYYYKIATQEVNTLRKFLDINKKKNKFVNY